MNTSEQNNHRFVYYHIVNGSYKINHHSKTYIHNIGRDFSHKSSDKCVVGIIRNKKEILLKNIFHFINNYFSIIKLTL